MSTARAPTRIAAPPREAPECIVLPARIPAEATAAAPVRIFLGSESAQRRAERVFVWSIEQVRDPARRYEIHLMKHLRGFAQRGWTTGFTNYRFAIPHFAGAEGRAIYNDADQVYLRDPAELFDLDMADRGFLSISDDDTSVMLMDCARMAPIWPLESARRERRAQLERRAFQPAGLHGRLAPEWNHRDGEYRPGQSRLLHFTALHSQPWRPFPERFLYHNQPPNEVWRRLERAADRAGFEVFDATRPSTAFAEATREAAAPGPTRDPRVGNLLARAGAASLLHVTTRPGSAADRASWGIDRVVERPLAALGGQTPGVEADAVLCLDGLEQVPEDDAPWVVQELFRRARGVVFAAVRCSSSRGAAQGFGSESGWLALFEAGSRRRPQVHWELSTWTATAASPALHHGGRRLAADGQPRVWVLADDRPGNTTQSTGLADELGWPCELKRLRFGWLNDLGNRLLGSGLFNALIGPRLVGLHAVASDAIAPPWPDLVIAAGRRTAPVARWIRRHSGGRSRIVQLGRKGATRAEHFDLAVTPAYCRLPDHPRRIETAAPLTSIRTSALERAAARWAPVLGSAPSPRVALLVGGDSVRHSFSADVARALGEAVSDAAEMLGAAVFVTTSRRTSPQAADALEKAVPAAAHFYRWSRGAHDDNPYLAYLALADTIVVTGESESMLAEACSVGRPVAIYPIPTRPLGPLQRLNELVVSRAYGRRAGRRGTARPQRGIDRLCARLVASGALLPVRDMETLHASLIERGLARRFDGTLALGRAPAEGEMGFVAERVRQLMGTDGPPEKPEGNRLPD